MIFDSNPISFVDVFMSLAMVTEKPERDIMSRAPAIRSKDHLLNLKLLIHAYLFVGNLECFTAFFCYCYYWIDTGVPFYSFMFTYENFSKMQLIPNFSKNLFLSFFNIHFHCERRNEIYENVY